MSNVYHAIVWVNHSEAKVYRFSGDKESEADLHSHTSLQRLHHTRTGWEAGGNPPDDTEFFGRINAALEHAEGTVITGPGNAKSALKKFLDHVRPNVDSHVLVMETVDDHPDALLALGRKYLGRTGPIASGAESPHALP